MTKNNGIENNSKEDLEDRDSGLANKMSKRKKGITKVKVQLVVMIILILGIGAVTLFLIYGKSGAENTVSSSSLKEAIEINELSTFRATHNGVAEVPDIDDKEKVGYYVHYNAKIDMGFDFEKLEVELDESSNVVTIRIPEIEIIRVDVDDAIDYLYINKSMEGDEYKNAYKAAEADAKKEAEEIEAIIDYAENNAKAIVEALMLPLIIESGEDYSLNIVQEGKDEE